jgi:hypothetical protein
MLTTFLAGTLVLALAAGAFADPLPLLDSADFPLWGKYEMNIEPVDEDLDGNLVKDFTQDGTSPATITFPEPGVMKMDASSCNSCYYQNVASDQTWDLLTPAITFDSGYTFEVRVKIISSRTYGFLLNAVPDDEVPGAVLNITDDDLSWGYYGSTNGNYSLLDEATNNSDEFHVFRVAQVPGQDLFRVWRDGVEVPLSVSGGITGDPTWDADSSIWFGDVGYDWGTVMEIDYLRFTSGAYAPDYTPPPDPIPGDANLNDVVDDADASILAAHWQQPGGWGEGDFNNDGIVNDQDASILAAHWLQTREGAAPVPEPSALVLLFGAGLIGLLARARRRQ